MILRLSGGRAKYLLWKGVVKAQIHSWYFRHADNMITPEYALVGESGITAA